VEGGAVPRAVSLWLAGAGVVLLWSGIAPYDRTTWWLEVFPVLLGAPQLVLSARRFPLTPLLYALLFVHAVILMVGGHYTYARAPLGFWAQDVFDLARNHYDRIGHLAWSALLGGEAATDFLGTQGDVWDTQWDMFLAGCGAIAAQLLLARVHDAQLARVAARP
jgi:putative membrane protein